jgi:hypothetical protein
MKSFLLAMAAVVLISAASWLVLDSLPMSAEQQYTKENVRL